MTIKKYHLQDQSIPSGFQIFEPDVEVAGIHLHKNDGAKFVKSKAPWLELQREPTNPHDQNAISVVGCSKGFFGEKRWRLGFLPKEIAAAIAHSQLAEKIRPRLKKTYLSGQGFVEVQLQLLGPKEEKKNYLAYWSNKPATNLQKELYRFLGQSPPKGLTTGDAQAFEEQAEADDPDRLKEWRAFVDIWVELSDATVREDYDLKKVTLAQCRKAVQSLQQEGKDIEQLSVDIDEVADKLIEIKPELQKNT